MKKFPRTKRLGSSILHTHVKFQLSRFNNKKNSQTGRSPLEFTFIHLVTFSISSSRIRMKLYFIYSLILFVYRRNVYE